MKTHENTWKECFLMILGHFKHYEKKSVIELHGTFFNKTWGPPTPRGRGGGVLVKKRDIFGKNLIFLKGHEMPWNDLKTCFYVFLCVFMCFHLFLWVFMSFWSNLADFDFFSFFSYFFVFFRFFRFFSSILGCVALLDVYQWVWCEGIMDIEAPINKLCEHK